MPPCTARTALGRAARHTLRARTEAGVRPAAAGRVFSARLHTMCRQETSPIPRPCLLRTSASTSIKPRQSTRSYHSHDHPPPPGPFNETERAILSAAYAHVPQHGFTAEALALGARDAGYLDISANLLPNGAFDLIRWHLVTRRKALVEKSKELEIGKMSTQDKVFALTWERLMGNRDVLGRWQEALAIMAQPSYVPPSLKELAQLADDIWFLAGDVSVDPSWYTKRASLSAVYVGAELFMTNDTSPDFAETRAFLRRRFDEVAEVGGALRSAGEWLSFTGSAAVNVLRSKGAPI